MFPSDDLFDRSAKLFAQERLLHPRDVLARKYLSCYDLQMDLAMRPHLSKRLIQQDHLSRARISSENVRLRAAHSPTYMDETIRKEYRRLDTVTRSQLTDKLEELEMRLMRHCEETCGNNFEHLNEVITKNNQTRTDRDKASLDIFRELYNSKFNELERQLHSLEEKVHEQFNAMMEEIAMSGRSMIQLKDQLQRLSDTQNSLLRELNAKAEQKLDTAGTNNSSMHFSVVVEEPSPKSDDKDLQQRVFELESEMKETLDRLSIHNNRLGMLTQRIDQIKQNNLNTLLDFKQSIVYKLQTAEKRQRKEYINLFNTLNDCATRARGNQMQLEAVMEKLNCFEGRILDKSSSLCLSQSLKDRRRKFTNEERFNQEQEMTDSVLFKKSDQSGSDELSMPPSLIRVISAEIQQEGYKTPLKRVSEVRSGQQNQDSLEQIDQSK